MQYNSLIPEFLVQDLSKSMRFYCDMLGFKIEYQRVEAKFAFLSFHGSQLMLEERRGHWETAAMEHPYGRGVNFQFAVPDLSSVVSALEAAKYPLYQPISENWYRKNNEEVGLRQLLVLDPVGYFLRLVVSLGTRDLKR